MSSNLIRRNRDVNFCPVQSLVCLKLSLEKFKSGLGAEESKALDEISRTVDEVIAEVRTVSHLLHPLTLDALGLRSSIMEYAKGFEERTGIQTSVEIPESLPKFEPRYRNCAVSNRAGMPYQRSQAYESDERHDSHHDHS